MKIPKSVVIRNKRWRVRLVHNLPKQERTKNIVGSTDTVGRVIYLDSKLRGERLAEVLIHEILHACSRDHISLRCEEKFVEDVDAPLARVLVKMGWGRR